MPTKRCLSHVAIAHDYGTRRITRAARGSAATARGGSPPRCAAWHRAHAESFACRGSVRGTVRGRAAHPARCHDRAAITHAKFARALRTRLGGRARCPHRAAAPSARCAAWSHAHYAHGMAVRPVSGALGVTRRRAPARLLGGARRRPRQNSQRVLLAIPNGTLPTRGAHAIFARALCTATGRCGAMGTSRPTAITHAWCARNTRTRITHGHEAMRHKKTAGVSTEMPPFGIAGNPDCSFTPK